MNTVVIHRPLHSDIAVAIKENSQLEQQFMNKDIVQLFFETETSISLNLGDYIEVFGKTYFLNTAPVIRKLSSNLYEYNCVFESYFYDLSKAAFLDTDATGIHLTHEFYLVGMFQDFINVILNNVERVFGADFWTFDVDVSTTDYKTLSFSENNCQQALLRVCEEFGVEFKFLETIDGPVIQIRDDVSLDSIYSFEYGKGKGLYNLTRNKATSNNLTTRLYVFGSTKNLGPNYRNYSPRLRLPPEQVLFVEVTNYNLYNFPPQVLVIGNTSAAFVRLQIVENSQWVDYGIVKSGSEFNATYLVYDHTDRPGMPVPQMFRIKAWNTEGQYVYSDGTSEGLPETPDFIENDEAITKYGVIERTLIFDEVFPHREGTVTAVGFDYRQFNDSEMFNLSLADHEGNTLYLIPNLDPKIKFNTGKLAGYEFVISQYKHDLKQFTIRPITDERGLELPHPSESEFQIHPGDKYVILDINLPNEYIETAENELKSKALAWLGKYSNEQVSYELSLDQKYVNDNNITFPVGNKITVLDQQLGINDKLRIVEVRRNLVFEHKYEVKLSDTVFVQSSRMKQFKVGVDQLSFKNTAVQVPQISSEPEKILGTDQNNNIISILFDTEEVEEVGRQIVIEKNYPEKKYTFSFDETKVNHNNLLNYEPERHRKLVYDSDIKAYMISE